MTEESVPFSKLDGAELVLDRIYEGGDAGNAGDDVISKLLPVGNQGGFRPAGSVRRDTVKLLVLYTSGAEVDWPDTIEPATGDFTYYGDNRKPGKELHDTPRGGNELLRRMFAASRESARARELVPPIFLFERVAGRDVRFRGLLVPGSPRLSAEEELVAIWRTTRSLRFQNYRAHFTVLQTGLVTRGWIDQIVSGDPLGPGCPPEWRAWVRSRIYQALEAPRNTHVRTKLEQLPASDDSWIIHQVYQYFSSDPVQFENFAAEMWVQFDPNVSSVEVTRASRDGGRDAVGEYRLGLVEDPVRLDFALEAKCYDPSGGGVGVRYVSRLISRIRHRQFGVFVTTAFVGAQAYQEVRDDGHPVVFLCGGDIVRILKRMGLAEASILNDYLETSFPMAARSGTNPMDVSRPEGLVEVEADIKAGVDWSPGHEVDVALWGEE